MRTDTSEEVRPHGKIYTPVADLGEEDMAGDWRGTARSATGSADAVRGSVRRLRRRTQSEAHFLRVGRSPKGAPWKRAERGEVDRWRYNPLGRGRGIPFFGFLAQNDF